MNLSTQIVTLKSVLAELHALGDNNLIPALTHLSQAVEALEVADGEAMFDTMKERERVGLLTLLRSARSRMATGSEGERSSLGQLIEMGVKEYREKFNAEPPLEFLDAVLPPVPVADEALGELVAQAPPPKRVGLSSLEATIARARDGWARARGGGRASQGGGGEGEGL